jgi:SPP1 gp7 family putative phage head morphogenesis protein
MTASAAKALGSPVQRCGCKATTLRILEGDRSVEKRLAGLKANRVLRFDPTHTTTIRNKFANDMTRRFRAVARDIITSIVDHDCFGLKEPKNIFQLRANAPAARRAFAFSKNSEKVKGFMGWLEEQSNLQIIQGSPLGDSPWMNVYIDSAYKKGMRMADEELQKRGITPSAITPELASTFRMDSLFNLPVHADRVGLIYSRAFNELKGITNVMSQNISRVLAQGMAEGRGPMWMAQRLAGKDGVVKKIGINRAKTLARTEVIRAHHEATMTMYEEANVLGVEVMAEWTTAGFDVCPDCIDLEGQIFTVEEIHGLIPLHPNCRCMAIPANVGEIASKRLTPKAKAKLVGDVYKQKDGTFKKRGLFKKKTGKNPPGRYVAPKARKAGTKRRRAK